MDEVKVNLVDILANYLDKLLVAVKLDVLYLHLVDDAGVVRCEHLCSVSPISLVAVVLFRVVACGDVDAALASKMTDGE